MKLTIELVPETSWFANLRSKLAKADWDKLRRATYKKARYVCEICSGKGDKWPVECHEIWIYDDENKVQELHGLIALCPSCHQVKHIGLAQIKGNLDRAMEHLAKVNGMSEDEARNYVLKCFDTWAERSQYRWKLDLTWLETVGVNLLR